MKTAPRSFSILLLLMVLAASGCTLKNAAQASRDFTVLLEGFQKEEIKAYETGKPVKISDNDHIAVHLMIIEFTRPDGIGDDIDDGILAVTRGESGIALDLALDSAGELLDSGTLRIKNPETKAWVTVALAGARPLLQIIAKAGGK